jgi:Spy/CpxP family protein refolding chaperone
MKRHTTLISIVGIVTVCTLGLALVSAAQPKAQANPRQMPGNRPNMAQPQKQDGFRDRRPGGNMRFGINLAGVELSEEQKTQVQQLARDFQVNTAEVRQQMQFVQQDLRKAMRNDPVDQAEVDALWTEITTLKQQLAQAQTNHWLALKGVLTAEQLATVQENEQIALELQKLRTELRELLLASGAPDVQRLQQIQAEIVEKEVVLERERVEQLADKFASLTPEQQEKLQNFQRFRQDRGRPAPQNRSK